MNVDKSYVTQPKALYYSIAIYMWEYFSYYGMRAILVLYLTQELLFKDEHAFALYGAYTALVYVTPILGGYIADKYLGYYFSTIIGAITMLCGHLILGISQEGLYFGLALIICGYGLFKTNISCLLGKSYDNKSPGTRDSGFALMYVGGNIGSFLAPILCAVVAQQYGWHYGFLLAAIGLTIGLIVFISGKKHFKDAHNPQWKLLKNRSFLNFKVFAPVISLILLFALFFSFSLYKLFAGYILTVCIIVSFVFFISIFIRVSKKEKKGLFTIMFFALFAMVFWVIDQQTGSSIVMFLERNVDRTLDGIVIPAGTFASLGSLAILFGGVLVSFIWKKLAEKGIKPFALFKIMIGMFILTIGFYMIAQGAKLATIDGHSSMFWVVVGVCLIGFAELFIDPVALSEITRLNPGGSVGFLAGFYMLITGSIANFLAAKVAEFTSVEHMHKGANLLITEAKSYYDVFAKITDLSFSVFIILVSLCIVITIYKIFSKKKKELLR